MLTFGTTLIDSRRLVRDVGLTEGMRVADFGCGRSAHIILPAAEAVGESGRVYAVDLVRAHLESLENLCSMHGVCNMTPVWGDFEHLGGVAIAPDSLDVVFLVNNLSLQPSLPRFADELRRLLKDSGKLVVVDWKKRVPHPVAPSRENLFDLHDAELELARHGFTKADELPVSQTHWGMILI